MTPIVYICYNRQDHVRLTLSAVLAACHEDQRQIHIYHDGSRGAADQAHEAVTRTIRDVIATSGHSTCIYVPRPGNLGLRQNITGAVTDVLAHHDSVIVIEDDILVNHCTLAWFDSGLSTLRDQSRVFTIQAFVPNGLFTGTEGHYLPGADSWGWATWKDRWTHYRDDLPQLAQQLHEHPQRQLFNHGSQANWNATLRLSLKNRRNSWAVRWRASIFLHDGLSLYPPMPMIQNLGHDGTGEHCTITDIYASQLPSTVPTIPATIALSTAAKQDLDAWQARHNSVPIRIKRRLKTTVRRWLSL